MWINALSIFRVENADTSQWTVAFSSEPLVDPVAGERKKYGFTPLGEEELFVDQVNHYFAFVGAVAERVLPKESVDREVEKQKRLNPDAHNTMTDADQVWCEAELRMLPHAPIKETRTPAVFCAQTNLLYVFGQSKVGIEALLTSARNALGSFVCIPLKPRVEVPSLITQWLDEAPPEGIVLGENVVFKVDDGSTTTIVAQDLNSDVVRNHLEAGEEVKQLSLVWRGEIEFTIGDKGELRKIGPPGCKMKSRLAVLHWPEIMAQLPAMIAELGTYLRYDFEGVSENPINTGDDQPEEDTATGSSPPRETMDTGDPQSGFVPLIVPGYETSAPAVHAMLDRLVRGRPTEAVVILKRPATSYRAAYAWANELGIPIVLSEWGTDIDWPDIATSLVCTDCDDETVVTMQQMAVSRGLEVYSAVE